jgi:hypothetical protein
LISCVLSGKALNFIEGIIEETHVHHWNSWCKYDLKDRCMQFMVTLRMDSND